jgi:hypothetical protein
MFRFLSLDPAPQKGAAARREIKPIATTFNFYYW